MIYVFDTSGFAVLFKSYYRGRFPSLWQKFDEMISDGLIVSTREVRREIEDQDDDLMQWASQNSNIFLTPTASVAQYVTKVYSVPHFQANIERKKLLRGGKNADPFVIATAATIQPLATVVTLEIEKPNAAKIPNICKYFEIPCINLEEFMEKEGWVF